MTESIKKRILLSPIGGQAMHGIIGYFKNKGAELIGIDKNTEAVGKHFVNKFFVVPDVTEQPYMGSILKIIIENEIDIFISWLDPEIIFWNEKFNTGAFSKELAAVHTFNLRDDLMDFYDKFKFSSFLGGCGFYAPDTKLLAECNNKSGLPFPLIMKPRVCTGSRNVFKIEGPESLRYHMSLVEDKFGGANKFVIQKYVPGMEYTVDFFANKGKVINLVTRMRIKHSGVSLIGEVIYDETIEGVIDKFASKFNIDGLNNIQVIKCEGKIFIIDFNPRASGTIMLSINAGVDLFNNLIEKKEQREITGYGRPKRIKMARYLSELYYD